jgi:hypothetical protein
MIVYVPNVSHNTFDVSGYDIYLLYYTIISRVVYRGVTGSFFGIGILPVSD